ncbi:hypothetical protein EDB81DRAFT_275861 [Dactylonectria macrodidyma]|uniref:MARVEL domain-containing protein n=1 Tax=Dactylonectria macrodidyma TaxID=307937 RepID=A0A9P9JN25_9HYPO|nr:hypothetical protein EDB81DRAFT_275861 [Dactylonectria macrodidyma]
MGAVVGLKFVQWFIRGVQFACAAIILAIYSYILAALHNHKLSSSTKVRAVEGISGFAALYTIIALLLLCCLAGRTLSSFIALVFDVAFIAAFIYVAVANREGASDCTGTLDTPFGTGKAGSKPKASDGFTALPTFRAACKLQSACLALAIIAIIFFVLSILVEVAMARNHNREKRLNPGIQNEYNSDNDHKGGFFGLFKRKKDHMAEEGGVLPEHTHPDQLDMSRPSHGTERTAVNDDHEEGVYNKYDAGYGYPLPEGSGRQDGYGHIHYPEPEDHVSRPHQQNYRYDDGVYDRT